MESHSVFDETEGVDQKALIVAAQQAQRREEDDGLPRPLIGISSHPDYEKGENTEITQTYATAITLAGGIPVALPCEQDAVKMAPEIVSRMDGILLTGGGDIHEDAFGGLAYAPDSTAKIDYCCLMRDEVEEAYVNAAWEADLPVLGICRGMQIMNVTRGGDLVRDVSEQKGFCARDHIMQEPFNRPCHRVVVEEGSCLAQILGGHALPVNSVHHQAIHSPAADGVVVAHANDGTPEGIEWPQKSFFLGVQWHPEMTGDNPQLFEAFVDAARERMLAPRS